MSDGEQAKPGRRRGRRRRRRASASPEHRSQNQPTGGTPPGRLLVRRIPAPARRAAEPSGCAQCTKPPPADW
ncbi:hypothetical protein I553_8651 [Mycobacterium xenopi 4042]|uniref:Uncharacterized protein n=1 Tax=Mycobacterium xenopi 4042 TaxID=1299334 RepID=X8CMC3_MYCXE|nr:hypothetical protein I553_8651 [Mycobacterium xenopi 4042]